jgi:hypothetical protein
VGVAVAERLVEAAARAVDDLLDGELAVVVLEAGDDLEQLALAVGRARPPAGEEVGVELADDKPTLQISCRVGGP